MAWTDRPGSSWRRRSRRSPACRRYPGSREDRQRVRPRRSCRHFTLQRVIEKLDPMTYRSVGAGLQVRKAADVGGGDGPRQPFVEGSQFARAQLAGHRGLQQRIGSRGAATEMRVAHGGQLVTRPREQRLDAAADLLAMLQRAGRLEGDARQSGALRNRIYGNDFAKILGQHGNARRLLAILRVLRQQVAVLLDGNTAAAR